MDWHNWGNHKDEKWDVIEHTLTEVSDLIIRSLEYATDREVNFLKSCQYHLSEKEQLSFSQNRWLKALMEKYSDDNIKLEKHWRRDFDNEKRKIAHRIAQYYQYKQLNPLCYRTEDRATQRTTAGPAHAILPEFPKRQWKNRCLQSLAKSSARWRSGDWNQKYCLQA